jgi:hypothetical protein
MRVGRLAAVAAGVFWLVAASAATGPAPAPPKPPITTTEAAVVVRPAELARLAGH